MPESNSLSRVGASRWKSVALTPKVSTNTVRSTTDGSSRCIWSWALVMVDTSASPKRITPRIDGAGAIRFASGLAESLTPKVGQRGRWASRRSKTSIGKLDSMPPSVR